MNRGVPYYRQGEFEHAIDDYTRAIELDPTLAAAYYNRGLAFRQKGLGSLAVPDFETYLRLRPDAADRTEVEEIISEMI